MRFLQSLLRTLSDKLTNGDSFVKPSAMVCALSVSVLLSVLMPSAYSAQEAAEEPVKNMAEDKPSTAHAVAVVADSVNINTADAETLALALDGVGLTRALDIIAYREEYGEFKNVEQIQQVRGIGIATFARNRTKMRVSDVE
jgi:competence protein ComEA